MVSISPTQSNILAALSMFLLNVLPGVGSVPAVFVGSISGTTLTVTALSGIAPAGISGAILAGTPVLGAAPGTTIVEQLTGTTGGIGTYQVSISQNTPNPVTMATGVSVVAGQPNRVAEPVNPFFVVMTPIRFRRFSTNVDEWKDCRFAAAIAGTTMTVSAVQIGALVPGRPISAPGIAAGTSIVEQLTGTPGEIGTYEVSVSQVLSSETMSAGAKTMIQSAEIVVQLDFHSSDLTSSDFSQTVSTALRDEYGVDFFAALSAPLNGVVPLYADDPAQRPFINAENAWEYRWVLDAKLQVDQIVTVPQKYADAVDVTLADVSVLYPP